MIFSRADINDEKEIAEIFQLKGNYKREVQLKKGCRQRVDLADSRNMDDISEIVECKVNDFFRAIGQILFYEFLLGRYVNKKIVLSYDCLSEPLVLRNEKINFLKEIKSSMGIDILFVNSLGNIINIEEVLE